MLLKCPHCSQAKSYSDAEFRRIFIQCKGCGKEFRAAECSPLTGRGEGRNRAEILEMSSGPPPGSGRRRGSGGDVPTGDGGRQRKGFLNRLLGRSG